MGRFCRMCAKQLQECNNIVTIKISARNTSKSYNGGRFMDDMEQLLLSLGFDPSSDAFDKAVCILRELMLLVGEAAE